MKILVTSLSRLTLLLAVGAVLCAGCGKTPPDPSAANQVALVLAVGGLGDRSVNDSAYAGLLAAKTNHGVAIAHVSPRNSDEFPDHLRRFARDGYGLVFGLGFSMKEPMEAVAREFTNTTFAIVDVPADTNAPNIRSLVFKEQEGAFLAGVLAARKSASGKVAFVGGMDIPLLRKWDEGYKRGVEYANQQDGKTVTVSTRFLDATVKGFADPVRGKEVALSLYQSGHDVILQVTGGSAGGIYQAARETGKFAIGSDQNQDAEAPGLVLTSVMRRLEPLIVATVGEWKTHPSRPLQGLREFGLADGGIALTTNAPAYLKDLHKEAVDRTRDIR
jgi:basic membrane protein A